MGRRRQLLGDKGLRNGETGKPWRGISPAERGNHWKVQISKLEEWEREGRIHWSKSSGMPRLKRYLDEVEAQGLSPQDIWYDIRPIHNQSQELLDFPTQKPEALVERILKTSSASNDLVLDCFIGSGTTAAVAQRLGRRWIGCDINKGAIQTTAKRLQTIIQEQIEASRQGKLIEAGSGEQPKPAALSVAVNRVNDYDLAVQHNEAINLACEHLGVERRRTDAYFDRTLGKWLVKIVPFGHPLTLLDLEELERELKSQPKEDRDLALVCLGKEPAVDGWLADRNRHRPVNKIETIELRTDKKYGKFFTHQPARARVDIKRLKDKIVVEIKDFISPPIVERLNVDQTVFKAQITDWRAMVDSVMIDTAYDGQVFNVALSDVPERKTDLVAGRYELPARAGPTTVAVKITDMLGEEVLLTKGLE
ncbi:MAG: DNA methyltransferase [Nitrospira sp.]